MQIIDNNTVVVLNGEDLKTALEGYNNYTCIYFGANITLTSSVLINPDKKKITIDGTYLGTRYVYTGIASTEKTDMIEASPTNEKIIVKNIDIVNPHVYGVIYVPANNTYNNVITEYNNVKFNGVQMVYNPYGLARIIDCNITIEQTSSIPAEEVGDVGRVEIGGNTLITSNASSSSLFNFFNNVSIVSLTFLPNTVANLTSETKDLISGTNRLNFQILHDAEVTITTGNGFGAFTVHGVNDVLIDERATFNFIENAHQRIPMWSIFGGVTIKEGANVSIINTYNKTPTDNYNMHFKGNKPRLTIYKPNSIALYNKNASVIYSNNSLVFDLTIDRINMWVNADDIITAGSIDNLPEYSWYKDQGDIKITGSMSADTINITSHNLTTEEISKLPELNEFNFIGKKQLSIGNYNINIDPINRTNNTITGHTLPLADVLIKYDMVEEIVSVDENGLFTYNVTSPINDNTNIEIVSNSIGSFIYKTRNITTPFTGELTLMSAPNNTVFSLNPISNMPVILPKVKEDTIKVIDSRTTSSNWKLYVHLISPLVSKNNFELRNALVFKTFNNDIIILNEVPSLVYTSNDNGGNTEVYDITWSTDKGLLLRLIDNYLEVNEEYNTKVIWNIEE